MFVFGPGVETIPVDENSDSGDTDISSDSEISEHNKSGN